MPGPLQSAHTLIAFISDERLLGACCSSFVRLTKAGATTLCFLRVPFSVRSKTVPDKATNAATRYSIARWKPNIVPFACGSV
jgi:hypothetical protein